MRLALPTEPTSRVSSRGCAQATAAIVHEGGAELDEARRTVEAYLAGHDQSLDIPVDWSIARGFTLSSLQRLAEVPYGTTVSYRELAARAGNERAPRAAGPPVRRTRSRSSCRAIACCAATAGSAASAAGSR